jgi:thiol-disulfide isomerase/thioredoxin
VKHPRTEPNSELFSRIPLEGLATVLNRRQLIKTSAACLSLPLLSGVANAQSASDCGIRGRGAPELEVPYWIDPNGESTSFKLADHPGKWVFLKCFQSWCPGCHSHGLPALKQMAEALADTEAVVFAGIQTVFEGHSVNTVEKVRETQLRYDLKMPMGHEAGGNSYRPTTMANYRTGGTPWMILISPDREMVFNAYGINADKAIAFLKEQKIHTGA